MCHHGGMWRLSVVTLLVVVACGGDELTSSSITPGSVDAGTSAGATTVAGEPSSGCADVIDVSVDGDGPYTFSVTVSSPDTGWDKYADQWRIVDETGRTVALRELTHPHVDEQPFTRSLSGVSAPPGAVMDVSARDSIEGYCGRVVSVTIGE